MRDLFYGDGDEAGGHEPLEVLSLLWCLTGTKIQILTQLFLGRGARRRELAELQYSLYSVYSVYLLYWYKMYCDGAVPQVRRKAPGAHVSEAVEEAVYFNHTRHTCPKGSFRRHTKNNLKYIYIYNLSCQLI
jgi:hypothetical protein